MKTKQLLLFVALIATNVFAADYKWTPAPESTDFALSTNWTPERTSPANDDNLIFDGAFCGASTTAVLSGNLTVNSLTVRNNCSVKLWADADNLGTRAINISASSEGLNIGEGCVLDLGKNAFSLTNGASVAVNTVNYVLNGTTANMSTANATNLGKIAAGQIAVGMGTLTKGAKVVSIDYATGAIVFDKNFTSGTGLQTQVFFFPPVCSGTGTLRMNNSNPSVSYYYPFTFEFYHNGAQTLYNGYFANLKLTGDRASTAIGMSNNIFLENFDFTGLSNYTINPGTAQFYFIGTTDQTMFTGFTAVVNGIQADGVNVTLSQNTSANSVRLFNGSKLFIGNYDLTFASTTGANYVTSATSYIVTKGTGVVKRTLATAAITFPIGASATSYDPVTITGGTAPGVTSVRVGTTLSGTAASGKAYNAKEWVITPTTAATATVRLSPSVSAFIITPIIGSWNGSSYTDATATLTGTADPYSYSASLSLAAAANKLVTGGTDTSTHVATTFIDLNGAKVYADNHKIFVANAKNEVVKLFALTGTELASKIITSDIATFEVQKGIYIVSINNKKIKVMVK